LDQIFFVDNVFSLSDLHYGFLPLRGKVINIKIHKINKIKQHKKVKEKQKEK
jgi:hypothetical protein